MGYSALDKLRDYECLKRLDNMMIISGRSAEDFTGRVCEKLVAKLDKEFSDSSKPEEFKQAYIEMRTRGYFKPMPRTIEEFNDGEIYVRLGKSVRGKDVHVFQCFNDKEKDVNELVKINDAAMRAGAESITVYEPYAVGQRAERKVRGREAILAKVHFNQIITSCGTHRNILKRLVFTDLHAPAAQGYFDGPVDEISATNSFAVYFKDYLRQKGIPLGDVGIVAPDAGARGRAEDLAKAMGVRNTASVYKYRPEHGTSEVRDISGIVMPVSIIFDDMYDTAGTIVNCAHLLRRKGAKTVLTGATHGVFSPNMKEMAKGELEVYRQTGKRPERIYAEHKLWKAVKEGIISDKVVITDTLPPKHLAYYKSCGEWLAVISQAAVYGDAVLCNQLGRSFSRIIANYAEYIQRPDATVTTLDLAELVE